ncbi:PID-CTERM protein-sorting domain-containing protein [Hymenobacter latericus]|uniref:PID-CTERM protein-sorting domain-containing protein n=1 Tax=Hymenobacter sp. YIM 151858-1 TaxID=2987688 RepID=UPI0022274DC4|nr:hypothetical protein [Hymenobacter sp. YIM 151858-1]UYZ60657.1 hypothetical protein OIS50_07615 [Hymenobacter sp. YIM 151858-1]
MLKAFCFSRAALLVLLVVLAASVSAMAQGPGTGGPTPNNPTEIPIDGGVSLLVAAAGALGIRQLTRRRRS